MLIPPSQEPVPASNNLPKPNVFNSFALLPVPTCPPFISQSTFATHKPFRITSLAHDFA
jgi:hypothetical protein